MNIQNLNKKLRNIDKGVFATKDNDVLIFHYDDEKLLKVMYRNDMKEYVVIFDENFKGINSSGIDLLCELLQVAKRVAIESNESGS